MEFPWGQIIAEKRAKEKESKLEDLQSRVDKASFRMVENPQK